MTTTEPKSEEALARPDPTRPVYYQTENGDLIDTWFGISFQFGATACISNVMKYMMRWDKKNGLEDIRKAQVYLNRLEQKIAEREQKDI